MTTIKKAPAPLAGLGYSQNWFLEENARALASGIAEFWRERGYRGVRTWTERVDSMRANEPVSYWVVRSNMSNGLPPRKEESLAA